MERDEDQEGRYIVNPFGFSGNSGQKVVCHNGIALTGLDPRPPWIMDPQIKASGPRRRHLFLSLGTTSSEKDSASGP